MSIAYILLALTVPSIIESQGIQRPASSFYQSSDADAETFKGPLYNSELDVALPQLEELEILVQRYSDNLKVHKEARSLFEEEVTEKDIAKLCATYSSLECGERVLKTLGLDSTISIQKKCRVRKEFLECIDFERRSCKKLADNKLYPVLPSKETIQETQEKVWRVLWTSGGCTLAI